jgi:perosamine synthetase
MVRSQLALLGGTPVLDAPLAPFRRLGAEEKALVNEVFDTGLLSGFLGTWSDEFRGGPYVRRLEADWTRTFGCKHAVTVNSNTSGLIAAMGAIGLSPGDEVIVPPFSMSATVMAPLFYGGIPVFVDIEPNTFSLDPEKVEAAISPRTKAILVVNLFGHPAYLAALRRLADERGIYLIEDNAQGPLAMESGRFAGTIGHIGVFSLNVHKHIQTGEGGICVTDDDQLALRMQLIRNHGENSVEPAGIGDLTNMIGLNIRMTEITAAIAIAQLEKGPRIVEERIAIADRLSRHVGTLPGITAPAIRRDCRHVYYIWSSTLDPNSLGVSRSTIIAALSAEGVPVFPGYVEPLYKLPAFQKRMAIGREGFPFTLSNRSYPDGLCPVAEKLYKESLMAYEICSYDPTPDQMTKICDAFTKVFENLGALRSIDTAG